MQSPWTGLLFLHGHVNPANLAWAPDASPCDRTTEPANVDVDIAQLPLPADAQGESTCCA